MILRRTFTFLLSTYLAIGSAPAQVIYGGQSIPTRPPKPSDNIGVDNSWYWDFTTNSIYGPKNLGRWPSDPAIISNIPTLPITSYGAKFDTLTESDGIAIAGSDIYTSASANFVPSDCITSLGTACTGTTGKTINIDFAGPSCSPLQTTILDVIDAHTIRLATPAICSTNYDYPAYLNVDTPQSGAGSYAPGDTVTFVGGTFTSATVGTVTSTLVQSATIVSGGSGGTVADGTDTGACYVDGTTGTGTRKFTVSLQLTGGIATSVNSVIQGGVYITANPTTLTNEPVLPTIGNLGGNCTGLAGAILSVKMGAKTVSFGATLTGGGQGQYSVRPANSIATTSTTGTGLTIISAWNHAGKFFYGTDDSAAWNAVELASQTKSRAGQLNCITLPGGVSLVTTSLPLWNGVGPCIIGQARDKTGIFLSASFTGAAISVANSWLETSDNQPLDGSTYNMSNIKYGAHLSGFTIAGTQFAPNPQQGIIFYNTNDALDVDDIFLVGIHGTCLGLGILDLTTGDRSFTRESHYQDILMRSCGSSTQPAFDMQSNVRGTSNDNHFLNINIYASVGIGARLKADGTAQITNNEWHRFRVESMPFLPIYPSGDNLRIGDTATTGKISNLIFNASQIANPQLNACGIRMQADSTIDAPNGIIFQGFIAGGPRPGSGVCIEYGRNNKIDADLLSTDAPEVVFTANTGMGNTLIAPGCVERRWAYTIPGPNTPASYPCYLAGSDDRTVPPSFGFTSGVGSTIAEGNNPGIGSMNLSTQRTAPWQIPTGAHSFFAATQNGSSAGTNSTAISSFTPTLTGTYTAAVSAFKPIDNGWPTSRVFSGFEVKANTSGNQFQETILGCQTAATNAATCRLTSDGTGTASTTNIANPRNKTAYAANLNCSAHDSTNFTNALSWTNYAALVARNTTAASVTLSAGTKPTPLTLGTTTGADITLSADTTNGGINATFAAPTTNSAIWVVSCHVQTMQTD